jgi:serine/threonine protein kinase
MRNASNQPNLCIGCETRTCYSRCGAITAQHERCHAVVLAGRVALSDCSRGGRTRHYSAMDANAVRSGAHGNPLFRHHHARHAAAAAAGAGAQAVAAATAAARELRWPPGLDPAAALCALCCTLPAPLVARLLHSDLELACACTSCRAALAGADIASQLRPKSQCSLTSDEHSSGSAGNSAGAVTNGAGAGKDYIYCTGSAGDAHAQGCSCACEDVLERGDEDGGASTPRSVSSLGAAAGALLGAGTFGTVWLAEPACAAATPAAGTTAQHGPALVAVKQLRRAELTAHRQSLRAVRELRLLARYSSGAGAASPTTRGVVRLLGCGIDGRSAYLLLQPVLGGSLEAVLAACTGDGSACSLRPDPALSVAPPAPHSPQPLAHGFQRGPWGGLAERDAAAVFIRVLDAMAHLHGRGVAYRDLKPENILLDPATRTPVLIDFGFAKQVAPVAWADWQAEAWYGPITAAGGDATARCGNAAGLDPLPDWLPLNVLVAQPCCACACVSPQPSAAWPPAAAAAHVHTFHGLAQSAVHAAKLLHQLQLHMLRQSAGGRSVGANSEDGAAPAGQAVLAAPPLSPLPSPPWSPPLPRVGRTHSIVGTPAYMAPEVSDRAHYPDGHGREADAWSAGMLLAELLTGAAPLLHPGEDPAVVPLATLAARAAARQLRLPSALQLQPRLSVAAAGATPQAVDAAAPAGAEPNVGPSVEGQSLPLVAPAAAPMPGSPVLPTAADLLSRLLLLDPGQRLTLAEAARHPWLTMHIADMEAERLEVPMGSSAAASCSGVASTRVAAEAAAAAAVAAADPLYEFCGLSRWTALG